MTPLLNQFRRTSPIMIRRILLRMQSTLHRNISRNLNTGKDLLRRLLRVAIERARRG